MDQGDEFKVEGQRLGETDHLFKLWTHHEFRNAALALAQQAKQTVHIFSHDLDSLIYNNELFIKALAQVAHEHRSSFVKILLRDASSAVKTGHRLLELCQKFSSDIQVRRLADDYENNRESFLIADKAGLLIRNEYDRYTGSVNFKDVRGCEKWLRFHNEAWERGQPISEIRRLYI